MCDVSPVPKSSPANIHQLRPITLLSIPAKLLEWHLLKHTRDIFNRNIPSHQYAYKLKSDTTCCLVSVHDFVTKVLDESNVACCVLINYDFSKAFDTINHQILLRKLQFLDFPRGFIRLMYSYLSDRKQRVRLGNVSSSYLPVTSGAPQGSLLGPLLFVIYCHDLLPLSPFTHIVQYADDICEIIPILKTCTNDASRVVVSEFDKLRNWAYVNNFKLNSDKTKAICFDKKLSVLHLNDFPIDVVENLKILGVTLNKTLKWNAHFHDLELRCSRRLYMLRVLKSVLTHDELWCVFRANIETVLLYCSPLFGILNHECRNVISKIFNRARRIICFPDCKCHNVLINFHERRRKIFDEFYRKSHAEDHPLHGILSHPSCNDRVQVLHCNTKRRQNCFVILSTLLVNDLCTL